MQPGDALVVRTGWTFSWGAEAPAPGMTVDAVERMQRRDVALHAVDVSDAFPPQDPEVPMPLHMVGLARLGMPLIDSARVDPLADLCVELDRL